jgi:formyl-CoA transferase
VVRTGIKLDGAAPAVDAPPPMLGQHSDELLAQLGYGADEIQRLREQGAI